MPEVNRKPIFDAARTLIKKYNPDWLTYTPVDIKLLDAAIDVAVKDLTGAQMLELGPAKDLNVLSQTSLDKLKVVHPKLADCVRLAIRYSTVDFGVGQSERSIADQKKAVASGNSRTMKSKHLKQPDGWVWAVDLFAYVDGKVSWTFELYGAIAFAMDRAATELGIASHIRWGGAWDRVLSDFGGSAEAYIKEVKAYSARHAGSDLLDGPHFEWVA